MAADYQIKILSRDQILAAEDLSTRLVNVPEWGGSVYVRGLSAAERDGLAAVALSPGNSYAKLLAFAIVDAVGQPIFTKSDIEALSLKSVDTLKRIFDVATELSGKAAAESLASPK